jgi:hypothetical protein
MMKRFAVFPLSHAPNTTDLQCKEHCCKPKELATFQVFEFTTLAVTFMEIDILLMSGMC